MPRSHLPNCSVLAASCTAMQLRDRWPRHNPVMSQQGSSPTLVIQTSPKGQNKPTTRRFKCNLCLRQFNRREHLQRHHTIHDNQKPHNCHLCDYACRRRDLLNRHIKLSHTNKQSNTSHDQAQPSPRDTLCKKPDSQQNDDAVITHSTPCEQHMAELPESLQIPHYLDGIDRLPTQVEAFAPTTWSGSDASTVAFNYLDSVSLPFFDAQPAFYPELSLNDSILFSPLDHIDSRPADECANIERRAGTLSRLGSLSPEPPEPTEQSENAQPSRNSAAAIRITQEDWLWISQSVTRFNHVLPPEYNLPSRHAFSRYLHGFVTGFHPHFPILHLPSLSIRTMTPELIIALAAVGSHYCLELHRGVELFHIAKAIALEQVRLRESAMDIQNALSYPVHVLPTPPEAPAAGYDNAKCDGPGSIWQKAETTQSSSTLDTIKALFFLMAMATWAGNHRPLVRQAIEIQSLLSMLIRQHGLDERQVAPNTWEEWIHCESSRRTKLVICSFFNLHRVLFNLPSPIMISDIHLRLPCTEVEWKATSAASWKTINENSESPPLFQEYFSVLFNPKAAAPTCSSLGTHIMIHALLQHIFSVQQAAGLGTLGRDLEPGIQSSLERALKRWQRGWELNSESSLNPLDKHGPVAFNSTALFHLAFARLAVDLGPVRSLLDQNHLEIAERLMSQEPLERGPKLTLAARHATAALCPPVQMGVCSVGRAPSWSVMHAVCTLDYAFILNGFLRATTAKDPAFPLSSDEQIVLGVLKETLREVEFSSPHGNPAAVDTAPYLLGPKAVRAWAIILEGMRTWNAVNFITMTLFAYAELLERQVTGC